MHEEDEVGRAERRVRVVRCGRDRREPVDRGGTHEVDARWILAETDDSLGAPGARGEMQVRELGDRVAHRLVGDALGAVAAVDVRDAHAGDRRRTRGGERLDPVAEDDDGVGRDAGEEFGEGRHASAERGRIGGAPRLARALHLEAVDAVPARLDLLDRRCALTAGGREQVRATRADLERQVAARGDRIAHRRKQAPFGARARDDRDAPHARSSSTRTRSASTARASRRPTTSSNRAAATPVPGRFTSRSAAARR